MLMNATIDTKIGSGVFDTTVRLELNALTKWKS